MGLFSRTVTAVKNVYIIRTHSTNPGYTVASIVAFGAIAFRYAVWLQRPATRVYWRRGWQLFRERRRLASNAEQCRVVVLEFARSDDDQGGQAC
jgi:hypothetical protein